MQLTECSLNLFHSSLLTFVSWEFREKVSTGKEFTSDPVSHTLSRPPWSPISSRSPAAMARVVEATATKLRTMNTLHDFLTWARIKGDRVCTAGKAGSPPQLLGADTETDIAEIGTVSVEYFDTALAGWSQNALVIYAGDHNRDVDSTPIDCGRARAFHRAARIWACSYWSAADIARWELQQVQATSSASASSGLQTAAALPVVRTIKLSEVADVTKSIDVQLMDRKAVHIAWALYKKLMHEPPPPPEQEPTAEQLSALADLLANDSCYVELSIWGRHGIRIRKAMRLTGMILGPRGELIPCEVKASQIMVICCRAN